MFTCHTIFCDVWHGRPKNRPEDKDIHVTISAHANWLTSRTHAPSSAASIQLCGPRRLGGDSPLRARVLCYCSVTTVTVASYLVFVVPRSCYTSTRSCRQQLCCADLPLGTRGTTAHEDVVCRATSDRTSNNPPSSESPSPLTNWLCTSLCFACISRSNSICVPNNCSATLSDQSQF